MLIVFINSKKYKNSSSKVIKDKFIVKSGKFVKQEFRQEVASKYERKWWDLQWVQINKTPILVRDYKEKENQTWRVIELTKQ